MAQVFYDHLIPWELVDAYVLEVALAGEERIEFITLVDELVHTEVMVVLLEHLPQEQHEVFLHQFHENPSAELHLTFLNAVSEEPIEQKITDAARKLLEEVLLNSV